MVFCALAELELVGGLAQKMAKPRLLQQAILKDNQGVWPDIKIDLS